MQHVPFPPTLVRMSAQAAEQRVEQNKKNARRPGGVIRDHEAENVAVIRSENGAIRPAYDVYRPMHLPGETPGIGKVSYRAEHYPNDTSGYVATVMSFETVEDLEARGVAVDRTAFALVTLDGGDPDTEHHLVTAENEPALAAIIAGLPESAKIVRPVVVTVNDAPIVEAFGSAVHGSGEIHAAPDIDGLGAMLLKRFPFLNGYGESDPDAATIVSRLLEHGADKGWAVAAGGPDLGDEGLRAAISEREDAPAIEP